MARCEPTWSAADFLPARGELPVLREAAAGCRGCDLYCRATQVVFGEGPAPAAMMLVGEQPGDQEDKAGRPFVGPAGRLLDEALEAVGIRRQEVYVTNVVKHFSFLQRGKRRLHVRPTARQMAACLPWLAAEARVVRPRVLVCLGATAAQGLLCRDFRITRQRGQTIEGTPWAPVVVATTHPSAILRMPAHAQRLAARQELAADLRVALAAI